MYKTITPKELLEGLKHDPEIQLIDFRTEEEFDSGKIADAKNINFYGCDIIGRIGQLDKSKKYFIYCNSGNRSKAAYHIMKSVGINEVFDLKGGIQNWVESGYNLD